MKTRQELEEWILFQLLFFFSPAYSASAREQGCLLPCESIRLEVHASTDRELVDRIDFMTLKIQDIELKVTFA
ncbi:MAG: hypothetical protein CMJ46_08390 [Planctomyces sp.]|nr:hypothetical protein [Planctomyces sp.]